MLWFVLLGCFAPQEGEWGFFDISESGSCDIETSESLESIITITDSSPSFSLQRHEDTFRCSLEGQTFTCSGDPKTVSSDEVQLKADRTASGEFDSTTSGVLEVDSTWSCVEGDCELYGLGDSCTRNERGTIRLATD